MAERTVHIHTERPRLRQVVEVHFLQELYFLHFLHFAERLPGLGVEVVGVLERTLMVGSIVGFHLRRVFGLAVVGRRDREVSRVVEHILLLGVDVHLQVGHRERGRGLHGVHQALDGVTLRLGVVGA